MSIIGNTLIVLGVAIILLFFFPIIRVSGDSMYPTYKDKEFLIGIRIFSKKNLQRGDVILYTDPTDDTRTVIKRIQTISRLDNGQILLFCVGDNVSNSYDSRNYGFISSSKIVCKPISQRGYGE
jgi:signal peptidase I